MFRIKVGYKKFICLLIVLIVSFVLCYLFNYLLFFWLDYGFGLENLYFIIFMKYFYFCIWFNSCLNFYLYGVFDDYFR